MKRRWKQVLLVLIPLAVAGGIGARQWRTLQANVENLPSAPARSGEFLVKVRCRGELEAARSVQLSAPMNVPSLQIVWLAPSGGAIRQGDTAIRFDSSMVKQQLLEKEASLRQAQATLEQAQAEAQIRSEQDKRDLSATRYQVERARMEVSKQEIVSAIQGEESRIDLGLAQEKQRVQQAASNLHTASDTSRIASFTRVRDQAQTEVDIIKRRIERMEVKTPLTGIIVYLSNYSQGWMNAKPFKPGDSVWPGSVIAEIPDLTTLQLKAKIEEIDRGRIAIGQEV
ncbi:MAG TPA: hypothetical protein VM120_14365, partial [Bryobacteraceae bacterium]|nr:hypothetical protein [Bryobacteraceae bacterium]